MSENLAWLTFNRKEGPERFAARIRYAGPCSDSCDHPGKGETTHVTYEPLDWKKGSHGSASMPDAGPKKYGLQKIEPYMPNVNKAIGHSSFRGKKPKGRSSNVHIGGTREKQFEGGFGYPDPGRKAHKSPAEDLAAANRRRSAGQFVPDAFRPGIANKAFSDLRKAQAELLTQISKRGAEDPYEGHARHGRTPYDHHGEANQFEPTGRRAAKPDTSAITGQQVAPEQVTTGEDEEEDVPLPYKMPAGANEDDESDRESAY